MNVPLLREPEPGDLLKPAIVGVVLVIALWFRSGPGSDDLAYYVTLGVVITMSMYARHEVIRRAERRLSAVLPRRMSRTEAVTIRTVLGRSTVRAVCLALVVQVGMFVVLSTEGRTTAAITFAAICAAAWLLSAGAVVQVTNRPVLAVDPLTLAVDDRLRTGDAFISCRLIVVAGLTADLLVDPTTAVGPWVPLIVLIPCLVDSFDGENQWGRYGSPGAWIRPRRVHR